MNVHSLPALNALLNGTSFVLLLIGYALIRAAGARAHQRVMIAAFACSVLFLTSYLIYHAQVGSVRFQGAGAAAHGLSLHPAHPYRARGRGSVPRRDHADAGAARAVRAAQEIARVTLPIWLYVSVTGVVIYLMLYQL